MESGAVSGAPNSKPPNKPRAYRARGFRTKSPGEVKEVLARICHTTTDNIDIRTVASSVGVQDFTAVFIFKDNVPRPECEKDHTVDQATNSSATILNDHDLNNTHIVIDSHFKGFTILHDTRSSAPVE